MPVDPRDGGRRSVAEIVPLKEVLTSKVETSLLVFAGAVAFVLLIAGANVANLLLIRASTRRQELAVRVAMGASRPRIVRQLLTESVLLALIGGAIGVLVASVGVRALVAMAPAGRIPRLEEVHVDVRMLAFTLGISLVTGVLFGLLPAFNGSRRTLHQALAQGARTVGRSEEHTSELQSRQYLV